MSGPLKRILFCIRKVEVDASLGKMESHLKVRSTDFDLKQVGYGEYVFFAKKSFATMHSYGIFDFDSRIQTRGELISVNDNVTLIKFSSAVRPEIILSLIVWIIFAILSLSGLFAIEWWTWCILLPAIYIILGGFFYLQIDGLQDVVEAYLKKAIDLE